jgi:hypothetical protein
LFLLTDGVMRAARQHPHVAERVVSWLPATVRAGFREIDNFSPMPIADRAALGIIGALTLLGCAASVLPLYLLARSCLPAHWAWASAALWPLVPSALLFQPVADTAFPFLSTSALALGAWAIRARPGQGSVLASAAGLLLGLGSLFTLAFFPVGLTVGLILVSARGLSWRRRIILIIATGLGFLGASLTVWAASGLNPFVVWWWNRINHARFYEAFPRSYARWVLVNAVELAIGLGVPPVIWTVFGLSLRRTPRLVWATLAVLALLNFGGLTLSEVARLWLPWMPALLVAAASGMERAAAGRWTFSVTVALLSVQTMIMQATLQVTYPAQ